MADVKLVSYTTNGSKDSIQEIVAYCARVSNPGNQANKDTSQKLINYLKEHKHWSPFEMVSICLEINTTRDIARQIIRHRSFTFQEFSQRYAEPKLLDEAFTTRETRLQDKKNRQNSIEIESDPNTALNSGYIELIQEWQRRQTGVLNAAKSAYTWAIDKGIAKEQARAVLPEGLTKSRIYMNGTLRSWLHYFDIRTGPDTQKEHRTIAKACRKIVSDLLNKQ
jgi:thymidylate synthase (FAD)|tara:strand:- start:459 stop:1127 length:669 start_codon:yes stop_codon:yes gene_type:complete